MISVCDISWNVRLLQHACFQTTPTIFTLVENNSCAFIIVTNNHSLEELSYSKIKSIRHLKLNHAMNFHMLKGQAKN